MKHTYQEKQCIPRFWERAASCHTGEVKNASVLRVLILEQLIERENAPISPPTPSPMAKTENPAKCPKSPKYWHLQKLSRLDILFLSLIDLQEQKMSTKQRYAELVWRAVEEIFYEGTPGRFEYLSVGEVAKKAGVSKPTVAKYLKEFHEAGYMDALKVGNAICFRVIAQEGN